MFDRHSPRRAPALLVTMVLLAGRLGAGPVPGVEALDKRPVDFPHPKHLTIWDIGNGEYLVTFRWNPGRAVEKPGVAGTFNNWSRTGLPMTGPDDEGAYSVTARVPAGVHMYKFVEGESGWHHDPRNPERNQADNGNSVLRLGFSAIVKDLKPARGDGKIETRAFKHDPQQRTWFDVHSTDSVTLRFRTLRDDVEKVELALDTRSPADPRAYFSMRRVATDEMFEYWEHHLRVPGPAVYLRFPYSNYTFNVSDGEKSRQVASGGPLRLDESRVFKTPEWARSAVWYQIMVDRFRDGDPRNNPEHTTGSSTPRGKVTHPWNSDWYKEQPWENDGKGKTFWKWAMYDRLYGGDFAGAIEKLDYLRELGVTALYLNPVFEATSAHKYNARGYVFADDGYGVPGEYDKAMAKIDLANPATWYFNESDKMLLRLIDECHKRGMKIVLDGVFNHLGERAAPFLDVKAKKQQSKFADWYDIVSWEPFKYRGWAGFGGLPQFKKDPEHGLASASLRQHIFAVTRRWMDPNDDGDPSDGIDGWRLDVPMDVPKPFWVEWRKVVKAINPEAYLVGEVWEPAEEWLDGTTFDSVMNYQLAKTAFRWFGDKEKNITATQFERELARLRIRYPRSATYVLQNLFDSHDTDRWVSRLANPDLTYDTQNRKQDNGPNYVDKRPNEEHYRRLKLMALFQATYVGAPMIWYGTEVGMYGADDPMCRMPMWWDDRGPYENKDYVIRQDLRDHFRAMFSLRQMYSALRTGEYYTLLVDDEKDCIAYLRYPAGQKFQEFDWTSRQGKVRPSSDVLGVLVVLNNSDRAQTLVIPNPPKGMLADSEHPTLGIHTPGASISTRGGLATVKIMPSTGAIIAVKKATRFPIRQ